MGLETIAFVSRYAAGVPGQELIASLEEREYRVTSYNPLTDYELLMVQIVLAL